MNWSYLLPFLSFSENSSSSILNRATLSDTFVNTYINEVFGVEDIRDFIAKQILFSSSETLNVDMLDNHLQSKIVFFDYFHITMIIHCIYDNASGISTLRCRLVLTNG